jgi:hypothetical protein
VSYNGGQGGTQAKPTPQQQQARKTAKVHLTSAQTQHVQAAKSNPQTHAKNNGGKPAVAATSKPGDMSHAVQAKAAGGHVDPKSLQANAKTAPVKHKGGNGASNANAGRANEPNKPAEAGKSSEREVPKPPSASGRESSGSNARATEPSAARPDNKGRESGSAAGMPQSEGAGHRASEPPSRSSEPSASHAQEPASHSKAAEPSRSTPAKERDAAPSKEDKKSKPESDKPQS